MKESEKLRKLDKGVSQTSYRISACIVLADS